MFTRTLFLTHILVLMWIWKDPRADWQEMKHICGCRGAFYANLPVEVRNRTVIPRPEFLCVFRTDKTALKDKAASS